LSSPLSPTLRLTNLFLTVYNYQTYGYQYALTARAQAAES